MDICSRPYDVDEVEGYGQRRICIACVSQTNVAGILEYREIKNWVVLGKAPEKKRLHFTPTKNDKHRNRYLQDKYPRNAFSLKPIFAKIPILKSGESNDLRSVIIGNEKINLMNTCAFDSFFQLLLTVSFDSDYFMENIVQVKAVNIHLLRLLECVYMRSVTASTYRQGCEIQCKIYVKEKAQEESEKLKCFVVNCQTTTSALCKKNWWSKNVAILFY